MRREAEEKRNSSPREAARRALLIEALDKLRATLNNEEATTLTIDGMISGAARRWRPKFEKEETEAFYDRNYATVHLNGSDCVIFCVYNDEPFEDPAVFWAADENDGKGRLFLRQNWSRWVEVDSDAGGEALQTTRRAMITNFIPRAEKAVNLDVYYVGAAPTRVADGGAQRLN